MYPTDDRSLVHATSHCMEICVQNGNKTDVNTTRNPRVCGTLSREFQATTWGKDEGERRRKETAIAKINVFSGPICHRRRRGGNEATQLDRRCNVRGEEDESIDGAREHGSKARRVRRQHPAEEEFEPGLNKESNEMSTVTATGREGCTRNMQSPREILAPAFLRARVSGCQRRARRKVATDRQGGEAIRDGTATGRVSLPEISLPTSSLATSSRTTLLRSLNAEWARAAPSGMRDESSGGSVTTAAYICYSSIATPRREGAEQDREEVESAYTEIRALCRAWASAAAHGCTYGSGCESGGGSTRYFPSVDGLNGYEKRQERGRGWIGSAFVLPGADDGSVTLYLSVRIKKGVEEKKKGKEGRMVGGKIRTVATCRAKQYLPIGACTSDVLIA
ncbi:hypothetical protein DFH09DRAFT_1075853 [Mycena vulgaris]|nr:hypothetical protein DFH09DRAFT_1075853 [Mycena vulgaris]